MYDICILIPTYKEEKNIKKLYYAIKKFSKNIKTFILFIDDSPNFKTTNEIKKYFKKNRKIIHRLRKENFSTRGEATFFGYKYIIKNINTRIIFDMDADLAIPPSKIPEAIKIFENSDTDFVINSKYHKKSIVKGRTLLRRIISRIFTIINKKIFDSSIEDYSAPRFYNTKSIKSYIKNNKLEFYTPILLLDTLIYLISKNFKYHHISTFYVERKSTDEGSINLKTLLKAFIEYLKLIKKYKIRL